MMGIGLLYFIVIIFANTIGAISGMGGGIIIRPVFEVIGYHQVVAISFYSSIAVFTMSITATYRQLINGVKVRAKIAVAISLSAIVGGFLGNSVFESLFLFFNSESAVNLVQIILTILSLIFVLFATKEQMVTYRLSHWFWYLGVGLFLGFLASLLGIGGGPINVALLMLLFSIPIKEATTYSIITIFFSQLARLVSVHVTTGFDRFDLSLLLWIIPAAMLGGFLGGSLSKFASERLVLKIFKWTVGSIILLNIGNGILLFV